MSGSIFLIRPLVQAISQQGPGQAFGNERFAPGEHTLNQTEIDQLQRLVERWIRKHHV